MIEQFSPIFTEAVTENPNWTDIDQALTQSLLIRNGTHLSPILREEMASGNISFPDVVENLFAHSGEQYLYASLMDHLEHDIPPTPEETMFAQDHMILGQNRFCIELDAHPLESDDACVLVSVDGAKRLNTRIGRKNTGKILYTAHIYTHAVASALGIHHNIAEPSILSNWRDIGFRTKYENKEELAYMVQLTMDIVRHYVSDMVAQNEQDFGIPVDQIMDILKLTSGYAVATEYTATDFDLMREACVDSELKKIYMLLEKHKDLAAMYAADVSIDFNEVPPNESLSHSYDIATSFRRTLTKEMRTSAMGEYIAVSDQFPHENIFTDELFHLSRSLLEDEFVEFCSTKGIEPSLARNWYVVLDMYRDLTNSTTILKTWTVDSESDEVSKNVAYLSAAQSLTNGHPSPEVIEQITYDNRYINKGFSTPPLTQPVFINTIALTENPMHIMYVDLKRAGIIKQIEGMEYEVALAQDVSPGVEKTRKIMQATRSFGERTFRAMVESLKGIHGKIDAVVGDKTGQRPIYFIDADEIAIAIEESPLFPQADILNVYASLLENEELPLKPRIVFSEQTPSQALYCDNYHAKISSLMGTLADDAIVEAKKQEKETGTSPIVEVIIDNQGDYAYQHHENL